MPSAPIRHWSSTALFWMALIWTLRAAQPVVAPIAFAVVFALLLAPAVRALRRRGVPAAAGAAAVIASGLLVLALLATALAQPAAEWWARTPNIVARLVAQLERARAALPSSASALPLATAAPKLRIGPADGAAPSSAVDESSAVRQSLVSGGVGLTKALAARMASFAISAGATVILLFFLLASEHWFVARIVDAFPTRRTRVRVLAALRDAQRDIGRFLGSLALIYTCVGIATAVAVAAIGLPNPLLWGVICILLNFIPYLGPMLIAAMLLLAALVSFEPGPIVFAPPLAFMLIHAVETNFVSPWFVAQRLVLSPIAVFLSVLFCGWMWGVAGAVIAVPLLVGMRGACKHSRRLVLLRQVLQGTRGEPASLRSLLKPRVGRPDALAGQDMR